jgi:hypothetical protein
MLQKVKASEAPKAKRNRFPRFEKTSEWKSLKATLDKGLKLGESWVVTLTEEEKKKYRIKNRRTVARFVRKYVKEHEFPYAVRSFTLANGDYVVVERPKKS